MTVRRKTLTSPIVELVFFNGFRFHPDVRLWIFPNGQTEWDPTNCAVLVVPHQLMGGANSQLGSALLLSRLA